jgi:c-di-GMP phosphodiesterase
VAILQPTLIRAKMCERLGDLIGEQSEHFFLVGILSSLDSILDIPLEDALAQLPLTDDMTSAILAGEGPAGEALRCVINYNYWNISAVAFQDLDQKIIGEAYIQSINWAKDVLSEVILI